MQPKLGILAGGGELPRRLIGFCQSTGREYFVIAFDGQNTSRSVNGVETLVVADSLSNLRNNLASLMVDPRPDGDKLPAGNYDIEWCPPLARRLVSGDVESMGVQADVDLGIITLGAVPEESLKNGVLHLFP